MIYVQPDGTRREIDAEAGDTVMTAATGNLVPGIIGDCGGGMSCATCHVFVDDQWLDSVGPREGDEDGMLETTAVTSTGQSRLGCQIVLDDTVDGLVVHVPECQE
nr:2Fe-2S iron-sulfur cluster-binding protein [Aeromicrobium sp. YIM 150415]